MDSFCVSTICRDDVAYVIPFNAIRDGTELPKIPEVRTWLE